MHGSNPIGKITRIFGNEGGLLLKLYDNFPEKVNNEEPLYVYIDTLAVPLFIEQFGRRGNSGAFVVFSDIDNVKRATELTGLELFFLPGRNRAEKNSETSGDEIDPEALVGFTAVIENGLNGTITAYVDNKLNPLWQLDFDGKEAYIPVADHFIDSIDTDRRVIELILPEGLLELYL